MPAHSASGNHTGPIMRESRLLKKDLFGEVRREIVGSEPRIVRDARPARPWIRWIARWLLRREARTLAAVTELDGVPDLIGVDHDCLQRSYIEGTPMHHARPQEAKYFRHALRLLRRLHTCNVVHNDLAKEPNLLVTPEGEAAFIDFQLALFAPRRGRLFRILAHDDLRHVLKHKRTYCPELLTNRERTILARPSLPSKLWMRIVKPPYLFVTRVVLGWADREGASDRGEHR